ncbi:fibronectin type III domain-containing protein, partial [bacterium]|nr:fibronectin type III domain-containing protein [bacterium]
YSGFDNAASLTAKDLFNLVDVLTFSGDSSRWVTNGVAKTRVETSSGMFAQIFAKTSHFSVFTVGEALRFTTPTTTSLVKANGVYTIAWNTGLDASNVAVTVKDDSGTTIGASSYALTVNATNLTLSGLFQQNTNVMVTLTGDTSSPAPTTFVIPMEITISNAARPPLVSGINVTQTALATQATVSWAAITGTTTYIRDIFIEYSQDSKFTTDVLSLGVPISFTSTSIGNLVSGKTYWWRVRSRNIQIADEGLRLSEAFFTDVTFGGLTSATGVAGTLALNGVGVTWAAITTTTLVSANILNTDGTIAGPNGNTSIVSGALYEFDFPTSAAFNSVAFSVNDTSSNLGLYHYNATIGGWEVVSLGDTTKNIYYTQDVGTGANVPACGFVVATNQTCIKLFSKGEGSPFAAVNVPTAPVVIRSGGGGGCSLTAGDDGFAGWMNFFLIFLPLGLLYIRRK